MREALVRATVVLWRKWGWDTAEMKTLGGPRNSILLRGETIYWADFDDDEAEVKIWIDELFYHDNYEDEMKLEVVDFMNGGARKGTKGGKDKDKGKGNGNKGANQTKEFPYSFIVREFAPGQLEDAWPEWGSRKKE